VKGNFAKKIIQNNNEKLFWKSWKRKKEKEKNQVEIFRNYSTWAKNQINEDFKVWTKSPCTSPNPSFDHVPLRNFLMTKWRNYFIGIVCERKKERSFYNEIHCPFINPLVIGWPLFGRILDSLSFTALNTWIRKKTEAIIGLLRTDMPSY